MPPQTGLMSATPPSCDAGCRELRASCCVLREHYSDRRQVSVRLSAIVADSPASEIQLISLKAKKTLRCQNHFEMDA
jgi:hypothetical protein